MGFDCFSFFCLISGVYVWLIEGLFSAWMTNKTKLWWDVGDFLDPNVQKRRRLKLNQNIWKWPIKDHKIYSSNILPSFGTGTSRKLGVFFFFLKAQKSDGSIE